MTVATEGSQVIRVRGLTKRYGEVQAGAGVVLRRQVRLAIDGFTGRRPSGA